MKIETMLLSRKEIESVITMKDVVLWRTRPFFKER